ncbi:MAG: hypothetical protein ACLP9L_17525 [Thermoguttaceae bacterium]
MDNKNSGPSADLVWPTLLSLVVAVSGYLSFAPQFESQRPKSDAAQSSAEQSVADKDANGAAADRSETSYDSRLWEDPLGAAYQKISHGTAGEASSTEAGREFGKIKTKNEPCLLVITVPSGTKADDRELRMRTRYAVHAALGVVGYRPDADDEIRVLPVTVPPTSPYEADGFAPQCAKSVPASDDDGFAPQCTKSVSASNDSAWRYTLVPFEHFRDDWARRMYGAEDDERYLDIVVFWLPVDPRDSHTLRRVGAIGQTVRDLHFAYCDEENAAAQGQSSKSCGDLPKDNTRDNLWRDVAIQVIGPYNSDLLLAMTNELGKINNGEGLWPDCRERIQLFPWRATLEFTTLKNVAADDTGPERLVPPGTNASSSGTSDSPWSVPPTIRLWRELAALPKAAEASLKETKSQSGLQFRVTPVIGTDWHLAHLVRKELILRNAWPRSALPADGSSGGLAKDDGFIVLVTEKDTLYGNTIPLLYGSILPQTRVAWTDQTRRPLIIYRYLQGVDGNSPLQEIQAAKNGEAVDQRKVEHVQGRDPQGDYQIDYLRRLADEIEQRDRDMKAFGGRGVLAIGIMGSDVYDKLLVLRALRTRFPRVCFFTHDLDENFCRPSELDYTQNLLVASHFGLSLHPALQREVPPFRDSYQTSAFLSVLMAVRDVRTETLVDAADENGTNPAGLWPWPDEFGSGEIKNRSSAAMAILGEPPKYQSRQHLAPLMFEIGRQGPYQLTQTCSRPLPAVYFQEGLSLQKSVQPPGSRESQRWELSKVAGAILAVALLVVVLAMNITAVRTVAKIALFWPAKRGQKPDDSVHKYRSVWIGLAWAALAVVLISIWWNHWCDGGQPFTLVDGVSAWPSIILRALAVLLTLAFAWQVINSLNSTLDEALEQLSEEYKKGSPPPVWKQLSDGWVSLWTGLPHGLKPNELLDTYKRFCCPWARSLRSLAMGLAYFALGSWVLYLAESLPNARVRGVFAIWVSDVVMLLAVAALCIITFLVVDIERFGSQFVRELGRMTVNNLKDHRSLPNDGLDRRTVRVIARHTHDINRVIWYPFIIMFLLVIARQRIFTGNDYPLMLAIVQLMLLVALYFSTRRLRMEADDAREDIVRQLRESLYTIPPATDAAESKARIEGTIKDIENEDEGAFGHWTQDCLLRALALPFLGESGFLLLQKWLSGG